ncbi:MAG TPA: ADYC domain-containing protein [Kofleriaceae bacterium]
MGRSLVLLCCLASCASEDFSTISSEANCPEEQCGSNSTVIDGVPFWEAKLNTPRQGVTLLGFENLPAGAVALDVVRDRLVAVDAAGDPMSASIEHSKLRFGVNNQTYLVEIAKVNHKVHYIANDNNVPIETYRMVYHSLIINDYKPLCETEAVGEDAAAIRDAIVFEGDRYDPVTRDVMHGEVTKGWFNIACLDGSPAKTFRLRAAMAALPAAPKIDTGRFQAAFSMWSADYCGDGTPYTVPGEPLLVKDRADWISPSSGWTWGAKTEQPSSYEAVWGPNGAVCLDTPRRQENYPGKDLAAEVREYCHEVRQIWLPRCTDKDGNLALDWKAAGYYLTANP